MNFLGKVFIEGKKLVDTVTEKATPFVEEAVNTIKEETNAITSQAKRAIDMGILKAEIETLYKDLGKAVYEGGLSLHNNDAVAAIHSLNEKSLQLEIYEKEIEAEEEAYIDSLLKNEENISTVEETEDKSNISIELNKKDIETSQEGKKNVKKIEIEVIEPSEVENGPNLDKFETNKNKINKPRTYSNKSGNKIHTKKHTESGGKKSSSHRDNKKNNK